MKKGFTLIELLAVILILGIIALIAIPTVNKILNEVRERAFRTGSDNIMRAIKTECQATLINGEEPVLIYSFADGIISSDLDVKGTMPQNGYIILNKKCAIQEYHLTQNDYVYSNISEEDLISNYMLKAPQDEESIFKTLYPSYYNKLLSINFVNYLTIPGNAIETKDVSMENNEKIKSWLVPNGGNYDLYIGSENTIYANYDSSYLLLDSTVTSLNMENLRTDFTTNFYRAFENTKFISLDLNSIATSNVTNMSSMFNDCTDLEEVDLGSWDTGKVINMSDMFYACGALTKIHSSNWNTSNVTDMSNMFNGCFNLELEVSNWNTSNVESIGYMFVSCVNNTNLDLSKWDVSKVENIDSLFWGCEYLETLNLSGWKLDALEEPIYDVFENCNVNNIIMKNSNYKSINIILEYLLAPTSAGTLNITGVDDISKVDTSTATNKNWNIIS